MNRLQKFETLKDHPWFGRLWVKLNDRQLDECRNFIRIHEKLSTDEFDKKCNRWTLDIPRSMSDSKISLIQWELMSTANLAKEHE